MPAVPSQLTSLDFFEIKESIKSYLRTRDEFSDYDFEGSSASYLIDILAYNTYYSAFNANMALNETFLESATVRDNIVRVAKQLNYTPRSIKAARACVRISVQTSAVGSSANFPETVTLRKGDVFVSRNLTDTFIFAVRSDIQVSVNPQTGLAEFSKVIFYQGNLLNFEYTVDDTKDQDFIVPSENVDTELMRIFVRPNVQSQETDEYSPVGNAVNLDQGSRVYFLEEADDLRYKIIFGDGVLGRKLLNGEVINIEYIRTAGPEANGCTDFAFTGLIVDSEGRPIPPQNIIITTVDAATDAEVRESPLSIKFNAPRSFATQNRAVTESDYEFITKKIYPQAASVTAYGGEKLNPPIYGKVYIAIRSKSGTKLNATTKTQIKNNLLPYAMASIEPVITDPTSFFVVPKSWVYYDGNCTVKSSAEIQTDLLRSIDKYNSAGQSNRFGGRIEGSKYSSMLDATNPCISGSVTQLSLGQNLENFAFGTVFTECLDFGNPIHNPNDLTGNDGDGNQCAPVFSSVKSGVFYATGYTADLVDLIAGGISTTQVANTIVSVDQETLVPVNIRDDGRGSLMLVTTRNEKELILNNNVGTVDYSSGIVCVGPIAIAGTPDGTERLPVSVNPYSSSIVIPPGVDPAIFNPGVFPIDYNTNNNVTSPFDPNNFDSWNYGATDINIIDYPTDTFVYPEFESCF
jgi:hypothetical protein